MDKVGQVFYLSDAIPVTEPAVSKHWSQPEDITNWPYLFFIQGRDLLPLRQYQCTYTQQCIKHSWHMWLFNMFG